MQLHSPPPNGFGASAYGPRGRQQAHGERWLGAGGPGAGQRARQPCRGVGLPPRSAPRRSVGTTTPCNGRCERIGAGLRAESSRTFLSATRGSRLCFPLASLRDEDDRTWRDAPGSRPLRCGTVGSGLGRHLRRLAGLARRAGRRLAKGRQRSENPEPGTGRPCRGPRGQRQRDLRVTPGDAGATAIALPGWLL